MRVTETQVGVGLVSAALVLAVGEIAAFGWAGMLLAGGVADIADKPAFAVGYWPATGVLFLARLVLKGLKS